MTTSPLLECDRIAELLPYGPEFLFVDSVWAMEPGRFITTRQLCTSARRLFTAHFRTGPHVVPGVLMAEQMVQSAWLLAALSHLVPNGHILALGRLNCRFEKPAVLPCNLTAHVEVDFQHGSAIGFHGRVHRGDDRILARCECVAKIVPLGFTTSEVAAGEPGA